MCSGAQRRLQGAEKAAPASPMSPHARAGLVFHLVSGNGPRGPEAGSATGGRREGLTQTVGGEDPALGQSRWSGKGVCGWGETWRMSSHLSARGSVCGLVTSSSLGAASPLERGLCWAERATRALLGGLCYPLPLSLVWRAPEPLRPPPAPTRQEGPPAGRSDHLPGAGVR